MRMLNIAKFIIYLENEMILPDVFFLLRAHTFLYDSACTIKCRSRHE